MTTLSAPEHVFASEKVALVAHYEPAGEAASVRFELRLSGAKEPFEAAKVAATASPARYDWIVALPKGTAHPTAVEFTATLEGQAGQQTSRRIQVHRRARRAIWASHALALEGTIEKLIDATMIAGQSRSYLDDISSITGIRNQAAHPLAVEWDTRVPNGLGGNNVARRARFRQILDYAHARGIDVLVGFEAVDNGATPSAESTNFMAFVHQAVERDAKKHPVVVKNEHGEEEHVPNVKVIQTFVDAIVAFMLTDSATKLPWDGISFDLEIGALGPKYRPVIRELFHRLHDHKEMQGKWLAYATFGYTDRLKGRNGAAVSHAFAKVQLFELARGKPNMIARPMLYEDVIDEAYLKQVIEYAYKPAKDGGAGLQRHQLQLGLQGDLQPGQAPRPGKLTDDTEVIPLITGVFRPACTGLVYFMLFNDKQKDTSRMKFFQRIDKAYTEGT